MADSFYSASWYRVADLKPRLRSHVGLFRHVYRGDLWYVLQDAASGKSHRLTPAGYRFIGLMNGDRSVDQLWHLVSDSAGDEAPTQDEIIRLLGQLHAADALLCDTLPDSEEIFRRYRKQGQAKIKQRLWSPLALRFPLLDPERFLERSYPALAPLFSKAGAAVWVATVLLAAVFAGIYWEPLTEDIVNRALTPTNLLVLWLVYPVVKALHELGHGYAVKHAGGEVHEIGIMLLVLIPVPYVDASSAWAVRDRGKRMLIGAAGIIVELFIGSIALFVWINAEAGVVQALAYNTILICGVSTLLFNGNPLLKFDGYYVFADAVEIPNLAQRSTRHLGYLIKRYLFRLPDLDPVANNQGERFWFVVYGIAAFVYRLFIMFIIILYIGAKYFVVGVLLAVWSVTTQIAIPSVRNIRSLFRDARARGNTSRTVATGTVTATLIALLVLLMPLPFWTVSDGVIWPGEKSRIRVGVEGFVSEVLVSSGQEISPGQPVLVLSDPLLEARLRVLEATVRELQGQLKLARTTDRVQVALIREELATVTADLKRARERVADLTIRSNRQGRFVLSDEQDLPGRFLRQGESVGYVLEPDDLRIVRVAVSHDEIALIADTTQHVHLRSVSWGAPSWPGRIVRQVPGGTNRLPTAALGSQGGGDILVDPTAGDLVTTFSRVFEVDVALPESAEQEWLGQRMKVRFDHGSKPLGFQVYRKMRQIFLTRFGV